MLGLEIAIHPGAWGKRWLSSRDGDTKQGLCQIGTRMPVPECERLWKGAGFEGCLRTLLWSRRDG
jgi:hypothetical protein